MPLILATEDIDKVRSKRMLPRPLRYSAGLGAWVQVSTDYEAFLILTPAGKKGAAANWINLQTLGLDDNIIRDVVAYDYMVRESAEVELQQASLLLLTEAYASFRSDFIDERFQGVSEVSELLQDTRIGADRLFSYTDDLEHRSIMATAAQTRYTNGAVSDARRRQAASWSISLLTPYL